MNTQLKNLIPIIILNWNGEDDTIECLTSINQSEKSQFFPVLIDNGSNPESILSLKNKCKKIYPSIFYLKYEEVLDCQELLKSKIWDSLTEETLIFIENGENLGFAKGNNVGIKFAEIIQAEWVMLLNNDTVVQKNTFVELYKFVYLNPSIKAVTPQIRYYAPDNKIWNCGGKLTCFGSRKYYSAEKESLKVPTSGYSKISFITGCALLFNYKVTGPLSEKFFFGEEDYEFSLRMKKRHIIMACVYDSIIFHKVGSTWKKHIEPLNSIYIHFIARLINTRNYYSFLHWLFLKNVIFLYIPILLIRNKINPMISLQLIRKINRYIKCNDCVDSKQFIFK